MDRRNFIKKIGIGLSVLIIAPKVLLSAPEKIYKIGKSENFNNKSIWWDGKYMYVISENDGTQVYSVDSEQTLTYKETINLNKTLKEIK
jgi:hypothetical protein